MLRTVAHMHPRHSSSRDMPLAEHVVPLMHAGLLAAAAGAHAASPPTTRLRALLQNATNDPDISKYYSAVTADGTCS